VVLRAVRDFWRLRLAMWVNRRRALARGAPILSGSPEPAGLATPTIEG